MFEKVAHNDEILAFILRHNFQENGIHFFTPDEYSQQLAYMKHPKDHAIIPHIHNHIERKVSLTQEVLYIKSGRIRVDFYTEEKEYLNSTILESGDTILLVSGGHGFYMLEETEMIEVKQGPFMGNQDKTRFDGIEEKDVRLRS